MSPDEMIAALRTEQASNARQIEMALAGVKRGRRGAEQRLKNIRDRQETVELRLYQLTTGDAL